MENRKLKKISSGLIPVLLLLFAILTAFQLISSAVQYGAEIGWLFVPLLLFIGIGLLVLFVLVLAQVVRLLRNFRQRRAGSRLTVRMVLLFASLSLFPIGVVYFYSQQLMRAGIESWFHVDVDEAMKASLELSQEAIDIFKLGVVKQTETLLTRIQEWSGPTIELSIEDLREQLQVTELSVLNMDGELLASSNINPLVLVPQRLEPAVLSHVKTGGSYASIVPLENEGLHVRVAVPAQNGRPLVLMALFAAPDSMTELSDKVEKAYTRYLELSFLRNSLKDSFSLILLLIIIFSALSAIWLGFYSSRRLVAPIRAIASGTRAVASGDYDKQLEVPKRAADELGFLVTSFNIMTRRIAQARDQATRARRQAETQRTYLQTILSNLTTGVLSVDRTGAVRTVNKASAHTLQLDIHLLRDKHFEKISEVNPRLEPLVEMLSAFIDSGEDEQTVELLLGENATQVLLCRLSSLRASDTRVIGHVLVFDDITHLIQAQRDAAWGEVARRLAHEIKNPLTPIQLSAERIRHRLLKTLEGRDAEMLATTTNTIVQQVEALKLMVNDFSDYARTPERRTTVIEFDAFVAEVLQLYQTGSVPFELVVELEAESALVQGDPVRLRQVVHNLVKNAIEATEGQEKRLIRVRTHQYTAGRCNRIELQVQDSGKGFDKSIQGKVFEPYITTKSRGTGLGLAIVKKIIQEHGGMIEAGNSSEGGGQVKFYLPVYDPAEAGPDCVERQR